MYVTCVFPCVGGAELQAHKFSKIAYAFHGQQTCGTHVSHLSCTWCVPYILAIEWFYGKCVYNIYNFRYNVASYVAMYVPVIIMIY